MHRDAACSREQGEAFKPEFGVTSLLMRLCLPLGYKEYALLNPKDILNLMAYILQYLTDVFSSCGTIRSVYIDFFLSFCTSYAIQRNPRDVNSLIIQYKSNLAKLLMDHVRVDMGYRSASNNP
jgi:hypothetical protein